MSAAPSTSVAPRSVSSPLLEMRGIEKSFGGVHALRGAELTVARGEIHALVGENGAGKSTLLKVLAGAYPHGTFRGTLRMGGAELRLRAPADARRRGIAMVHQELMLIPGLSVAANLFLGREPRGKLGMIDDATLESDARMLLARYGFADVVDPVAPVSSLGVGLQQIVEIVRGLSHDTELLVLDEPTASLTASETDRLMAWLRDLRAAGTSSVYVSHRMDEVFAMADRITVLRDGRTVRTVTTRETTPREVVALMVGRDVEGSVRSTHPAEFAPSTLQVDGLCLALPRHARAKGLALDGVTLQVRKGEVVAVCGAMGSGRTALLSTLFGCAEGDVSGIVRLDGEALHLRSPADAIARGIAYLPEDRKEKGLVLDLSVEDNLALPFLARRNVMGPSARFGLVDDALAGVLAGRRIREMDIRADARAAVSTLSGGNQQKVALGKWLERPPKLLLLDEPTRGVDIGAREEIYRIVDRLLEGGTAVLMASSDLNEVLRLAHRILILRRGRLVAELRAEEASLEAIVRLTTGAET